MAADHLLEIHHHHQYLRDQFYGSCETSCGNRAILALSVELFRRIDIDVPYAGNGTEETSCVK